MSTPATPRQFDALGFARDHLRDKGYPPTILEIAAYLGVTRNAANDLMVGLERKGLIQRTPGIARGLRIVVEPQVA